MRMQREEKIVVVLLLMALGSLAVAFWAFAPEDGERNSSSDSVSQEDSSVSLSVEGLVLEIKPTKSGGNLLLKLDSTPLPIFIPGGAGAEKIQNNLHPGDQVRIKGKVSLFQGNEEIRVDRAGDVVCLK
jgi:DNA/RNA endonuclease YhcR with UshA esterase domain